MRVCDVCGKHSSFGHNVSKSMNHTRRMWKPNLVKMKVIIDGSTRTIKVCTRCIRSDFLVKKVRIPKQAKAQETNS